MITFLQGKPVEVLPALTVANAQENSRHGLNAPKKI